MHLIRGEQQQYQVQPPIQQPQQIDDMKTRIKSRAIKLAKWIFGFWFVIMLPFKLLSNLMVYNDTFRMSEILSSLGFAATLYVGFMVVVVVGSFVIKD